MTICDCCRSVVLDNKGHYNLPVLWLNELEEVWWEICKQCAGRLSVVMRAEAGKIAKEKEESGESFFNKCCPNCRGDGLT